jgi:hypothetical protein
VLPVENVRRKRSKLTKSWGDPLSPLFHEGAQNLKLINLSILPRWVAGFQAAEAKLVSRAARFGGMAGQIKVREMRHRRYKSPSCVLDRRSFDERDGLLPTR